MPEDPGKGTISPPHIQMLRPSGLSEREWSFLEIGRFPWMQCPSLLSSLSGAKVLHVEVEKLKTIGNVCSKGCEYEKIED